MAAAHILVEVCETPLALPQLPPTAEKKEVKIQDQKWRRERD